ncbi:basic phospholipase A2 nigexine-like [Physella acuta]|uniref:basic phospholipase A2 nigexine-like n=1 Tax=Physella acuta TaxID=109671 RepID=UPI0027DD96F1|nr:basic phospholipase A2 nigexine-like [Physella acuta]
MTIFNHYFIAVLVLCACVCESDSSLDKRNVYQLQQILSKVTGRGAYFDYDGYGCWCGRGGSGTPVDATDRCCQAHDQCYDRMIAAGCDPYLDIYDYSPNGSSFTCDSSNDACELGICQCDVDLANCAAASAFDYSKKNYDRSKC